MFSKKKIKTTPIKFSYHSKKKKNWFFGILFWFFWVLLISFLWINFLFQVSWTNINFWYLLWLKDFEINLEEVKSESKIKSTDGKTNILIIWRWWDENDAPDLTDSIILASIDYSKKTVSMLSFPRDLYVKHPTWWEWKLNETYRLWLDRKNPWDITPWIENLKKVIKQMTLEEIHYYINLDFEWFRKIINTIWWIEIDVPERIVDTTYPWKNHSYVTFKVEKWLQTMDWETALRYARSRHSTSDFDRSIRQQLIIKALKEKALSLWIITSPTKINSIFNITKQHIKTDLEISQIINLALFAKEIPKDNITSSNLNTSCEASYLCNKWGFLYNPLRANFWWKSVLLQKWATKWSFNDYSEIQRYAHIVFNYPWIFRENIKINLFNSTKVWWIAWDIWDSMKKYGFNIPMYNAIWNIKDEIFPQSKILYYTPDGSKPETVKALEEIFFGWSELISKPQKYSKDPEVFIEIVIWDDYNTINL